MPHRPSAHTDPVLSKNTAAGLNNKNAAGNSDDDDGNITGHQARVIANHGSELTLRAENGETFSASPKKKLDLVVTGDLVLWQAEQYGVARVTSVLPRTGTLARTDRAGRAKPIATNVNQVLVVTAPKPPFDTLLLDRYCVAAATIGAEIAIIINKTDLLDKTTSETAHNIEALYSSLGYKVARCCVKDPDGLSQVRPLLDDRISILVGQSGVGKSSILKALMPEQEIKTGHLSDNSGLGRHTTTVTNWYDLAHNGAIIDSPGVRQFSLEHLDSVDIQAGFREISEHAAQCKFNDCSHQHEPECHVLAALVNGEINKDRYDHFLQLIRSE